MRPHLLAILASLAVIPMTHAATPVDHPPTEQTGHQAPQGQNATAHEGTVKELIPAERYTYLLVAMAKEERWLAIPRAELKVGEKIHFVDGMVMNNFHSKTLNRDFPLIHFLSGVQSETGAAALPTQAVAPPALPTQAVAPPALPTQAVAHPALPTQAVAHPALPTQAVAPVPAAINSGTVKEVVAAEMYTYLLIGMANEDRWLAITRTDIKVGEVVSFADGAAMKNFHSKALNRDFPMIYFLNGVEKQAPAAPAPAVVAPAK